MFPKILIEYTFNINIQFYFAITLRVYFIGCMELAIIYFTLIRFMSIFGCNLLFFFTIGKFRKIKYLKKLVIQRPTFEKKKIASLIIIIMYIVNPLYTFFQIPTKTTCWALIVSHELWLFPVSIYNFKISIELRGE